MTQLGPYWTGFTPLDPKGIYTGDAKELCKDIPDESIDLIFTDPVYWNIEDYEWLAIEATRVLKPEGACLVWASTIQQYKVQPVMAEYLRFVSPLRWIYVGKPHRLIAYNIFVWGTPLLWFDRGASYPRKRTIDTIITSGPPKGTHKWNKNPECFIRWIEDFTKKGDIIWDPFTGGGSIPKACRMLDRRYLAFEIEPEIAEMARWEVERTNPPLPLLEYEQTEIEFTDD